MSTAYVAFFGLDKFAGLPGVERGADGSVTLVLGDSPASAPPELRERYAAVLGRQSFVNPQDVLGKQPGRFALTFDQLLSGR